MFYRHSHRKKIIKITTELSLIRLIIGIGLAGVQTVWVLYMKNFGISDPSIGFISSSLVIVSIITAFFSTLILEKLNEYKILITSLLVTIISFVLIANFINLYLFLFLTIILAICAVLRLDSFDILFRDKSKSQELNENEGLMYALINVGWLVGPLIAGFVLLTYGINIVFLSSAIFIGIGTIILLKLKIILPIKKRDKIDSSFFLNFKDYIKNKQLRISYIISAGIQIWWALIYIYMPLFIINNGVDKSSVGIFLASVVMPLIISEYGVSKLSQIYGFKKYLVSGFLLLSIFAFCAFLINNLHLTLFLLVLASIPMVFIEPLQDSFFFKQVRKIDEEKYLPIYGTAIDIGSFIGKFSIAIILLFLPYNYAYLIIAIFMFLIGLICLKIKE